MRAAGYVFARLGRKVLRARRFDAVCTWLLAAIAVYIAGQVVITAMLGRFPIAR